MKTNTPCNDLIQTFIYAALKRIKRFRTEDIFNTDFSNLPFTKTNLKRFCH